MSGGAVVAVIWLLVFIIGVVVGVIAVIALSVTRKDRKDRKDRGDRDDDLWPERDHGASGIPGHWDGGMLAEDRPQWPDGPDDEGKS
jgi:hypothetical protein